MIGIIHVSELFLACSKRFEETGVSIYPIGKEGSCEGFFIARLRLLLIQILGTAEATEALMAIALEPMGLGRVLPVI